MQTSVFKTENKLSYIEYTIILDSLANINGRKPYKILKRYTHKVTSLSTQWVLANEFEGIEFNSIITAITVLRTYLNSNNIKYEERSLNYAGCID